LTAQSFAQRLDFNLKEWISGSALLDGSYCVNDCGMIPSAETPAYIWCGHASDLAR
jgi:hypothetical protein